MRSADDFPPSREELIQEIEALLRHFDRPYLQALVNRMNRDRLAEVWTRINRYNSELRLVRQP